MPALLPRLCRRASNHAHARRADLHSLAVPGHLHDLDAVHDLDAACRPASVRDAVPRCVAPSGHKIKGYPASARCLKQSCLGCAVMEASLDQLKAPQPFRGRFDSSGRKISRSRNPADAARARGFIEYFRQRRIDTPSARHAWRVRFLGSVLRALPFGWNFGVAARTFINEVNPFEW